MVDFQNEKEKEKWNPQIKMQEVEYAIKNAETMNKGIHKEKLKEV